ncbi:ABC transporter permease [Thermocrispum sp.]|uniref:ABC transporter permease n=1 Tax=Thermocrispum sp. TaxID=2060768 RepID=UPI00257CDD11|nr:ABC transporter permease [Thermocrispum sp.]
MIATAIRAELVKQAHRPAGWLLLGIGALLTMTFAYLVPYVGLSDDTAGPGAELAMDTMLPGRFVGAAVGGLPVFVGALALIYGVLVAGSEYGFDTWKAVLVQHPSRLRLYAAKLATVAAGTLTGVLVLFTVTALCSLLIASLEDQPVVWPSASDIATGAGAAWLMATMWATLGVALAIVLRSVALPIGLGLVWMLAVQNLLAAIGAPLVPFIADLQTYLPGPNAGALAAAVGASPQAPGVDAIVGAGHATVVVTAYLVAFCALGGWLLHRRDIT